MSMIVALSVVVGDDYDKIHLSLALDPILDWRMTVEENSYEA